MCHTFVWMLFVLMLSYTSASSGFSESSVATPHHIHMRGLPFNASGADIAMVKGKQMKPVIIWDRWSTSCCLLLFSHSAVLLSSACVQDPGGVRSWGQAEGRGRRLLQLPPWRQRRHVQRQTVHGWVLLESLCEASTFSLGFSLYCQTSFPMQSDTDQLWIFVTPL